MPSASDTPARRFKILFVQESPCIRNYKMARALRGRGHSVSLAYTRLRLSQMYKGLSDEVYERCVKIDDLRALWELSGEFDLVHCHNEPDVLSVAALGGEAPVIHDTHDLISLRAGGDANLAFYEGLANRAAAGRVYTTPYQMEEARRLYGVKGPCLVFYNYASQADLPRRRLPKLSQQDGGFHLVYEGGIGGRGHRDFSELFIALARAGITVHIHPTARNPELERLFAGEPNIRYHAPASPREIMEIMTRYDAGIIPFNLEKGNRRFLDSTIANKLFEYLAAGLPVVTSDLKSYREFFRENPVGFVFREAGEVVEGLPRLRELAATVDFNAQVRTYEGEVHRLEDFYRRILEGEYPRWAPEVAGAALARRVRDVARRAVVPAAPAAPAAPVASVGDTGARRELLRRTEEALSALEAWVRRNGWAGHDPYDLQSRLLELRVEGKLDPRRAGEILRRAQADPLGVRRELGVQPQVNAKAMGLFLSSYALMARLWPGRDLSQVVQELASWLEEHRAPGMSGWGWGYPFDWESVVIIPAGTPTGVNSYHVGDAFWELYRLSEDPAWLGHCLRVATFMAEDLNIDQVDERRVCFSYTPLDFYHVHNANLCVGEFLLRVGLAAGKGRWQELGKKALAFALADLARHGHLTYWARGYEPSPANRDQMDHYHTAAELRSLHRFSLLLPEDQELARLYHAYLRFYLENFFTPEGRPKIHPGAEYPFDIHAWAEAAYLLGEVAAHEPAALERLESFLPWFLAECRNPDGSFIYQIREQGGALRKDPTPYLRWGQAWTMRGLCSAVGALRQAAGGEEKEGAACAA